MGALRRKDVPKKNKLKEEEQKAGGWKELLKI
jgi:hypothetical protein